MFLFLVCLLSLFLTQLLSFCIHLVLSKDAGREKINSVLNLPFTSYYLKNIKRVRAFP